MAMLSCLLIFNLSGTWQNRKLFWLTAAYVLASAWPFRETARQETSQFTDPINVVGQGVEAVATFSEATNADSEKVPTRRGKTCIIISRQAAHLSPLFNLPFYDACFHGRRQF